MQRMLPLKALRPHLYGTRRLEAGDEYEAPAEQAIALVANRRADFIKGKKKEVAAPVVAEQPKPEVQPEPKPQAIPIGAMALDRTESAPLGEETLDSLRLQATQLGIDIDGRWGAARLQIEIAKAKL